MFNALFTKTDEYARLAQALGGPGACALFGIPGSGRAMVYAALAKALDKPLCIVTPGEAEATRFAGDLNALGVAAAVFPARDYVLRPIEGTGREYEYRRLAVLGDLVGGRLQAVCVPDEGLTQYTTPRADFCANTRSLRPGDTLPRAELTALLYGAGYTRRDQVDGPGQFSIRGDIADIYAPDMKQPARMEFWGDEIDTMHTFDLATQRRDEPIEKIYVSPAREILFGQPADAAEKIRSYIKKARGRRRTALETCTAADLAQLDGGAMPVNMDKYLTLRYPEPATILDYFDDPLLILEEPASLREAERATAFRRGEELSALLEDGVLAAGLDKLYAESGWLWAQCAAHRTLCAENFARSMPDVPLKTIVNAPAHAARLGRRGRGAAGGHPAALQRRHGGHGHGRHAPCGGRSGRRPAHQRAERHDGCGGGAERRVGADPAGAAFRRVQPAVCEIRRVYGPRLRRERRTEEEKAQ